jgi:hypothetical protein
MVMKKQEKNNLKLPSIGKKQAVEEAFNNAGVTQLDKDSSELLTHASPNRNKSLKSGIEISINQERQMSLENINPQ